VGSANEATMVGSTETNFALTHFHLAQPAEEGTDREEKRQ
jgi:hypothetical protein